MIQVCPMRLMHGLPIVINEYCSVRQPQLKEIDAFGYDRYRYVLSTFLVKKQTYSKHSERKMGLSLTHIACMT